LCLDQSEKNRDPPIRSLWSKSQKANQRTGNTDKGASTLAENPVLPDRSIVLPVESNRSVSAEICVGKESRKEHLAVRARDFQTARPIFRIGDD
jgi:hypothetical protein